MIADVDEWLHPVEGDSAGWVDAMSFTAWDAAAGLLVATRIDVTPNSAQAVWITWRDGGARVHRAALDHAPSSNWDVMQVGGIGVRMEEARRRWSLHLEGDRQRAFLVFEGTAPCAGSDQRYDQSGTARGDLSIDGDRIAVDGLSVRDHCWGQAPLPPRTAWFLADACGIDDVLRDDVSAEPAGEAVTVRRAGATVELVPVALRSADGGVTGAAVSELTADSPPPGG